MKPNLLLAAFVILFGLGSVQPRNILHAQQDRGCYIRLYKINKGLGAIYQDGFGGSHSALGINRHRKYLEDRYEVQSLEVEGNEVTCCFTVFRFAWWKGARTDVRGNEEYDNIRETGLVAIKSFVKRSQKYCQETFEAADMIDYD